VSVASLISSYLSLNLLIATSYVALRLLSTLTTRGGWALQAKTELRLHYLAFATVIALSIASPLVPKSPFLLPSAKVWSAPSFARFHALDDSSLKDGVVSLPMLTQANPIHAGHATSILGLLFAIIIASATLREIRGARALRKILRESIPLRRVGKVVIQANDTVRVPFSYWLPSHAGVIVPTALVGDGVGCRVAIVHELQHHRQRDTLWIHAFRAFSAACLPNPAIHLWSRWLAEIQEFACDETLVDRSKVESRQYARCLIQAAETALHPRWIPVRATGMVPLVERNMLKRRIEKMLVPSKTKVVRSIRWSLACVAATLAGVTAFASHDWIQDKRVTREEASRMVARVHAGSGFPVVVNDQVLKQLNRYLGTPDGREFMRASLRRMKDFHSIVDAKLAEYRVPTELAAIPIVESGYQNLAANESHATWGAGLWMFIEKTARNYGLRVDSNLDERMNPELLTDAAMRLLKSNQLRFNDWLLSVLAYNAGEKRVDEAIQKTGSRDAWVLVRSGIKTDPDYLARVVAAALIMKNPETLDN
jgi:membrane-bound lytic murein transglycosylase D